MSKPNHTRKFRRSKTTNELEEADDTSINLNNHIGPEYQASIPNFRGVENMEHDDELKNNECADIIWSPCEELSEDQLKDYIEAALIKHGFNEEQALALLKLHKNQIQEALQYLGHYTSQPSKWSIHDKSLFEEAFLVQGKNFTKIHEMMPEKSVGSIVHYYYSWKKTKLRKSRIDELIDELRKNKHNNGSDDGFFDREREGVSMTEPAPLEISDNADKVASKKRGLWNKGCIGNRINLVEDPLALD